MTQLLEQVVRVVTIYLLGAMMYQKGKIDASVAVWGLAAGEIFSCFLTWICYRFSIRSQNGGIRERGADQKNPPTIVAVWRSSDS